MASTCQLVRRTRSASSASTETRCGEEWKTRLQEEVLRSCDFARMRQYSRTNGFFSAFLVSVMDNYCHVSGRRTVERRASRNVREWLGVDTWLRRGSGFEQMSTTQTTEDKDDEAVERHGCDDDISLYSCCRGVWTADTCFRCAVVEESRFNTEGADAMITAKKK